MFAVSCEQYASLIGDLVDGTLDGAPRHELENHLATCAACTRLAEDLLVVRRAWFGVRGAYWRALTALALCTASALAVL